MTLFFIKKLIYSKLQYKVVCFPVTAINLNNILQLLSKLNNGKDTGNVKYSNYSTTKCLINKTLIFLMIFFL